MQYIWELNILLKYRNNYNYLTIKLLKLFNS